MNLSKDYGKVQKYFCIRKNKQTKIPKQKLGDTKMQSLIRTIAITAVIIGLSRITFSQENLIQMVQQLDNYVMKTTLQPFGDAVSTGVNSGLYNTAKVDKKFSLYVGVKAAGTSINPELLKLVGLEKLGNVVPFAVAQTEVGIYGTQVMFRYIPNINLYNKATVGLTGFGIKHCITSHFEDSPVDVSLQFAYQLFNIKLGKNSEGLIETRSTVFNLQISKEIGFLTLYTGAQYEKSGFTLSYNFGNVISLSKSFDNANNLKGTVGLNIGLGPINLNADYNFGKINTVSAGFGFGF